MIKHLNVYVNKRKERDGKESDRSENNIFLVHAFSCFSSPLISSHLFIIIIILILTLILSFSHSLILVLIIIITIIAVIVLIIIVILIVFFTFLFINLLQLTKPSQHHSSIKMFYILKNF